jgi:prevent-host-death family protein
MTVIELKDIGSDVNSFLARVRAGEEVVVSDAGQPIARVVPVHPPGAREFGYFKGQVWMAEDFDAPLPDDELAEWEK